jgi:hypothetical protein
MKRLLACALLLGLFTTATLLISQTAQPERVGVRPGGGFLLNSGWTLRPAGEQVPLSSLPMASALAPGGKYVVILQAGYRQPTVTAHELGTFRTVSSAQLPDAWLGLAFAPGTSKFYVGGASSACVYEFELTASGQIEARRTFPLVAAGERKASDFIGDAFSTPPASCATPSSPSTSPPASSPTSGRPSPAPIAS